MEYLVETCIEESLSIHTSSNCSGVWCTGLYCIDYCIMCIGQCIGLCSPVSCQGYWMSA